MPSSPRPLRSLVLPLCLVLLALVVRAAGVAAQASPHAEGVEIRRTSFGVPHVLAEDLDGMGYGLAWVMMEDYREDVPRALLRANGRWGLAVGPDEMEGDFAGRLDHEYAAWTYHRLPADVRAVYAGYAAGLNDFIRLYADSLPEWARPEFTPQDVAARDVDVWDDGAIRAFAERREEWATDGDEDPEGAGGREARGLGAPTGTAAGLRASADPRDPAALLNTWMAWARRAGEADPEVGSNAWAFGPERSESGNALLLRNPHLSYTAGYYEAHVRVPGVIDFYGDFRLGGPFTTIGGFNRRLGWATTNNYPDLDQVYALAKDPEADAYLFDGGSVPVVRREVRVEYADGRGGTGTAVREMPSTPLGPVIHETADSLYVLRAWELEQYRVGEQWLRMMQADDLAEWTEAMKIRAKVSSNLTYADADGNVHLVWNAALPDLPHAHRGDTAVAATGSDGVWTSLVPYAALPQVTNPEGGYVQNANDPPYYTNLHEQLDPASFPENMPEPRLRFRSQNSLGLVHTDDELSLEEMVELKHSMGMELADKVKDGLVEAVRARHADGEVREAIDLVAAWDNTAAKHTRGSTLFEQWAFDYFEAVPEEDQFAVPWSTDDPMGTPRGVGDPEEAAAAFARAVAETERRFGRWDVTWGEVHRLRAGDKDVPVGGCASALGCFRVVGFVEDDDGLYRAYRGDGWVLAVEFGEVPRAYSVLAYGNSNRPESPLFYDQAELFSRNHMKEVAFTEEAIAGDLVRSYRPAELMR